jgi:cytochrome c-type biogenesis protein CcmH/NrfF
MDPERVSLKTVLLWVVGQTILISILTIFLFMSYMDNREMRKRIDACNDTQIQTLENVVRDFKAFLEKKDTDKAKQK